MLIVTDLFVVKVACTCPPQLNSSGTIQLLACTKHLFVDSSDQAAAMLEEDGRLAQAHTRPVYKTRSLQQVHWLIVVS